MASFPLVFHASQDETVAWRDGTAVPVRAFLADVMQLAAVLPAGEHVFNMCTDRYRFAVGLCATLVAGKISLLPASQTPEALRQLSAFAADTFCLHDAPDCTVDLPRFAFASPLAVDESASSLPDVAVPQIDASQTMAYLFTSGSTGTPVPHAKKWGFLVKCLRTSAARLGLLEGKRATLVGTVPPQHMYGFEMTVLVALIGGLAFSNRRPFYPLDVAAELAAVPEPRVLVTSPVHLRTLAMSGMAWPPVALTLSATAPLTAELASAAEAQFGGPLVEIYGSTETGQIATRRTALGVEWELMPGVVLQTRTDVQDSEADETGNPDDDGATIWASGGHVETPVPMGDSLELLDDTHFLLRGRKSDLINIGGRRTSLAYLNHQLTDIPGVVDGVFFMPDENYGATQTSRGEHVTRLLALVVAPGLAAVDLQRALRERVDPAFMPRPLLFVDSLPRNATGKLPKAVLTALVRQQVRHTTRANAHGRDGTGALTFTIPVDHPAMSGHFPGQPIVPGVVLLDHAIAAIGAALNRPLDACRLGSAKFPSPARPGEPLELTYDATPSGAIRFSVSAGSRAVASGVLALDAQTEETAAL